VQKHIRTAGVLCDKSEAAVGIPHFQFSGAHPIFPFSARTRPDGECRAREGYHPARTSMGLAG
jgi:hypothetical protein